MSNSDQEWVESMLDAIEQGLAQAQVNAEMLSAAQNNFTPSKPRPLAAIHGVRLRDVRGLIEQATMKLESIRRQRREFVTP